MISTLFTEDLWTPMSSSKPSCDDNVDVRDGKIDTVIPHLLEEARALAPTLAAWRHHLHMLAETGMDMSLTSAFVQQQLTERGLSCQTFADGSGVTCDLGQGDDCILLRADMDALPVVEDSGEPFAATNGHMHACGHDLHATALLGAAALLKAHEPALTSRVRLLFQPGEEVFAGAQTAIDDGVLDGVDRAFGLHVTSMAPLGVVLHGDTPNAAAYGFEIALTGKGSHGAMPSDGISPINTAVHIYLALHELIARECPPDKQATLTIGQLHAGTASNIIPETALMQGTLRVFDEAVRETMIRRIGEVVAGVAATYRTQAELRVLCDIPVLRADRALHEAFAATVQSAAPALHVRPGLASTASEDFAFIAQRVPSVYLALGAKPADAGIIAHHNPKVRFSDDALPTAAALYAAAALTGLRA